MQYNTKAYVYKRCNCVPTREVRRVILKIICNNRNISEEEAKPKKLLYPIEVKEVFKQLGIEL